jgi:hypothetical protein
LTDNDIGRVLRLGGKSALNSWSQSGVGLDELVQQLWVWYLERPGTQKKFSESDEFLARKLTYRAALQILSRKVLDDDEFRGKNLYSTENIKAALKGEGCNPYLAEILPKAFKALEEQNAGYASAVKSRYSKGSIPKENAPKQKLKWAVKSLTEHVNRIAITAEMYTDADGKLDVKEGPGSRKVLQKKRPHYEHAESPDLIKVKGEHSDPTARIALLLLQDPHQDGIRLRDEYLHETSLQDLLEGKDGA